MNLVKLSTKFGLIQCADQGVAFFFKQWGGTNKKKTGRELGGMIYDEMPMILEEQ